MNPGSRSNFHLGLILVGFAVILLFVWIPLDIETGLIEQIRRRVVIGDAAAPTIAALFVLIGALLLITLERRTPDQPSVEADSLRFVFSVIALFSISLLVMRYLGPLLVSAADTIFHGPLEYRLLRDTAPWKYLGYFAGGTLLVAGLISLVERRLTLATIVIGAIAAILFMAIFDLPFDDLLLPPNGDV